MSRKVIWSGRSIAVLLMIDVLREARRSSAGGGEGVVGADAVGAAAPVDGVVEEVGDEEQRRDGEHAPAGPGEAQRDARAAVAPLQRELARADGQQRGEGRERRQRLPACERSDGERERGEEARA